MIKNIAYFPSQAALNSGPVLQAVLTSLTRRGINHCANDMNCDAAVIWSVLWYGRMLNNRHVYQHYRQQGRPVIVIEVGALKRGQTWKLAVNNATAQGYYGHQENLDPDRPKKLGLTLGTGGRQSHIVIALQHLHSLQVEPMGDMKSWLIKTIAQLREHTDRPIRVRPHPRSRWPLPPLPLGVTVEHPKKLVNTYDSYDLTMQAHAMVNYNSGPGIQAAVAGVRPVVDVTSLAWPVAVDMTHIEQPYDVDRQQWLTQISHTEYTVAEIEQGTWLERLGPALAS